MTSPQPNLRLLDDATISRELDLASEVFHRINRIIPENQVLLTVPPDCTVREAVSKMREHGYSQLPVVENGEVLGVFSYRSFAVEAAKATLETLSKQKCAPGDLPVDDCLEQFEFARVTEEINTVFSAMDRDNGVLIGTPEQLVGVLTPMDFLRYLYQVAGPFVLVSEIELALRAIIRVALPPDEIANAARKSLGSLYNGREDKIPVALEQMTFDNYQSLIGHGETWPQFESLLGGKRTRASAKLKEIGEIRNDLFHFKREIRLEDHLTLSGHRNWLLSKVKQAESNRRTEAQP